MRWSGASPSIRKSSARARSPASPDPESANNAASTGAFVPMLALGLPTGPITAVLIAALMIHGVPPGPTLVNEHPNVFWGFVASMYVGNLMLLALNLPLVSLFVSVLRIPYAYLYPLIIMFCIIGVYEVNHSIVDVWIMLIMGVRRLRLRKFGLRSGAAGARPGHRADLRDVSLRQSLIMSNGSLDHLPSAPDRAGAARRSARSCSAWRRRELLSPPGSDWRAKMAAAEAGSNFFSSSPYRTFGTVRVSSVSDLIAAWTQRLPRTQKRRCSGQRLRLLI